MKKHKLLKKYQYIGLHQNLKLFLFKKHNYERETATHRLEKIFDTS